MISRVIFSSRGLSSISGWKASTCWPALTCTFSTVAESGPHFVLHLHGFQYDEPVAGGTRAAFGHIYFDHQPGHGALSFRRLLRSGRQKPDSVASWSGSSSGSAPSDRHQYLIPAPAMWPGKLAIGKKGNRMRRNFCTSNSRQRRPESLQPSRLSDRGMLCGIFRPTMNSQSMRLPPISHFPVVCQGVGSRAALRPAWAPLLLTADKRWRRGDVEQDAVAPRAFPIRRSG